jgi:hypothetical protein
MAGIIAAGVAASGGRVTNPKPTATYNSVGIFNITNNDSTANYSSYSSVTGGTLTFSPTNTTVTLSATNVTATVANRTPKGVTTSPSVALSRAPFTYTYVAGAGNTGACYNYSPPGGTRYGGQWMSFNGGPYTYLNAVPNYTQAPSEWYKIV